jgi:bisanhydrobacterioruberin hydratase
LFYCFIKMTVYREFVQGLRPRSEKASRFILIFYLVGLAGFMIPATQDIFICLTKWALLLNFILLMWFHEAAVNRKTLAVFGFIILAGIAVEIIGVRTGLIFGSYTYGGGLGIKVFDTPLLIGINWLMLTYCFASFLQPLKMPAVLKVFPAAAGMVVYDLVMEQTAPMLQMWTWEGGNIPLRNYLAWFVTALIFQSLMMGSRIILKNKLAVIILLCQFAFFFILMIYKILLP